MPLTESKHENLLENRTIRRDLGGANEHFEQCDTVPEILDTSIHGAHTVCYKKFTMAKSLKRRSVPVDGCSDANLPRRRLQRSGEGASTLFPVICMICKSREPLYIPEQTKRQSIKKLTVEGAEVSMQKAAHDKGDKEMKVHVDGGKLKERKFQVHDLCFKNYTRPAYVPKRACEDPFLKVKDYVKREIIANGRAVSIATLTSIYGQLDFA